MTGNTWGEGRSTIETVAGRLAYRDTGTGRVVLALHGLFVDGHYWDRVTPALDGARVVVPDLPLGAHRTPLAPDADLTPPGLARLVADLMAGLDLRDVILVGSDMGGAVAQLVAAGHGERLAGFVLCSCDAFDHFFPPSFKYLQALGYLPGGLWLAGQGMRIPGQYRSPLAFGRVQKRPVPPDLARYWLSAFRTDPAVRRDLGKVLRGVRSRYTNGAAAALRAFDRPTRLVWADTTKVFPLADGRRLAETIPGATLTVVPDSYAHVPLDAPRAVAEAITGLL